MAVPYITDSQNTGNLVTTGLLTAWSNASSAFQLASTAINAIASFVPTITAPTNVTVPHIPAPSLSDLTGRRPVKPNDLEPKFPAIPTEPNFNTIEYGDIPDFPDVELSYLPIPEEVINTSIERYSSTLLSELKAKLLGRIINGGTGLPEAVETAIFNRDQERALLALDEAKARVADDWAKRGFSLPNGLLVESMNNLETEFVNKRLEVSRDISIKQAELEQTNINTAIQFSVALES
ncbi:MAG: hypothetical protein C0407_16620, partial [Desulfobacca sp.]|nr:hypothetical protein [Desulfobacca sp.]